MTTTVTKTIQIGRSAADGFDFIADPQTMPRWAIHNVKAIRRLEGGRWEMETPRGKATLVPATSVRQASSITISSTRARVSGG
ncbi:MAG: hypothetical protein ACHQIF_05825 [Steroidobacterales bacterium]